MDKSDFVTQNNQGGAMHHTLKDHQGSLTAYTLSKSCRRPQVREESGEGIRSKEWQAQPKPYPSPTQQEAKTDVHLMFSSCSVDVQ